MDESSPIPPKSSSNSKFAVIGLLLLLGGGGAIYALTRPAPQPETPRPLPTAVDAGQAVVPPAPSLAAPIELTPEEPDAGQPAAAQPARTRVVYRYVSECSGTLTDPAGVQRTAQANYGALRACYERELRQNNTLRGGLTAQLKINASGHADEIRVSTPMSSRPLVECIKGVLRRLSYPASRGGCALSEVRFNFSPRE
ncbi:MAG: AgmX/PglI C-terminal domain-containing protein [Myxococcales bacterium]|nr:AgmX/PglI C-terminal domain-containing protein [Myxococcales bacterium]